MLSFVDVSIKDKVLALALSAFETGSPLLLDDFLFFPSKAPGQMRFVDVRAYPVGAGLVLSFRDLTEHHQGAEQLARSRELFEQAFASSIAGICLTDHVGRIQNVNRAFREMLGRDEEELSRIPWKQLVHAADREQLERDANLVASGEQDHSWTDLRFLRADGELVWCELALACTRDQKGEVVQFICQIFDVSESRERELALRASNERFARGLVESPVGMSIVTPQGQYVEANPAFCRIVGRTRDELMMMSWQELTHPDDLAIDEGLSEQVVAGVIDSYRIQKRYLRPDGSIAWVELSLSATRDEDGSVAYYLSQLLDVTAQRSQTEALRLSEERHRQTMMNANVGVVIVDLEGRYLEANPAFCEIVGLPLDEVIGTSTRELSFAEDIAVQERAVEEILAGRSESFRVTKRYRRPDGSVVVADLSAAPLRDSTGSINSFVVHVVDVSDRVARGPRPAGVRTALAPAGGALQRRRLRGQHRGDHDLDVRVGPPGPRLPTRGAGGSGLHRLRPP